MTADPIIAVLTLGGFLSNTPDGIILAAATVAAIGVIWRKVISPMRLFLRHFKEWMHRIELSTTWVEEQMRTNGGSSLVDKVDTLGRSVDTLNSHVTTLLSHDAERDIKGRRYGPSVDDD